MQHNLFFFVDSGEELSVEWREILLQLADQAVRTVVPDLRQTNSEMDIRFHVKVRTRTKYFQVVTSCQVPQWGHRNIR